MYLLLITVASKKSAIRACVGGVNGPREMDPDVVPSVCRGEVQKSMTSCLRFSQTQFGCHLLGKTVNKQVCEIGEELIKNTKVCNYTMMSCGSPK